MNVNLTVVQSFTDAVWSTRVGSGTDIDALVVDARLFRAAVGSIDALQSVTF